MATARVGLEGNANAGEQPSHNAIDKGNPAHFNPRWFVLDDANIDLITFTTTIAALGSFFLFRSSIKLSVLVPAAIILPLRLWFPRPKTPEGLVLITGASSGIGAELSYIFAERGHELILVGRNEEQLEAVQKNIEDRYGKSAYTISSDLSLPGAAKQLYDHVIKEGYIVDVLVNGAGLGGAGDTFSQPIELVERMTILNCISLVQLTQLFGKDMIERGWGWLLHISSVGGFMASPGQNIYHATKHYVRAFSEALSLELRAYPGIVNTQLLPGPTHTQFITRAHAEETFMMAASGAVEDPKAVALAGYKGLCEGKRMIFSSWNSAFTSLMMQLAPRSVQLTLASIMNAPLRGWARSKKPEKDQKARGSKLGGR
ncbi:hypothetical protein B0J14DRAFT_523471 [Halenospora varia]|nr:hypothetical protein B0J14DRAFT_523471 [Halenospora varia]